MHFLIIPKAHVATLYDGGHGAHQRRSARCSPWRASWRAKQGATDGFRTIINTGRVGHQEVYHVHMHVIGGPEPLGRCIAENRK